MGPGVITDAESDRLLERAEGNPFFLEEIVRWRAAQGAEAMAVPETVEGVILARIDRLEEDVREVLKVASVVGRSFLRRVLEAIVAAGIELDAELGELLRIELIRERQRLPELEYIFKHALVQEATYGSILRQRRLELHRRVGECIERLFPERLDEFYGLLAHHYGQAEDWPKAHEYLLKAADEAGRIAATPRRSATTAGPSRPTPRSSAIAGSPSSGRRSSAGWARRCSASAGTRRPESTCTAPSICSARATRNPSGGWAGRSVRELARQMLGRPFARLRRGRSSGPPDWERCGVYGALCWIDYLTIPALRPRLLPPAEPLRATGHHPRDGLRLGRGRPHGGPRPARSRRARIRERSRALAGELGDPFVMGDVLFAGGLGEHVRGHWGARSTSSQRRSACSGRPERCGHGAAARP